MKTTLSLCALTLITSALILPMQAQAADRQISVEQKKFPTFTVDDSSQVDTAEAKPQDVKPKAFTVDDQDTADVQPPRPPKKVTAQRFEMEDQPEQSQSTPAEDLADDVAEGPAEKPVKLLKAPPAETADTEEANDPNELRYYVLKKKKHHVQYQEEETYQPADYGYQEPSYAGSNCHNSNNGY